MPPVFPNHQQNDDTTCGPACLQMLLQFLGRNPGAARLKFHQLTLYAKANVTTDTVGVWASAPDGMGKTANDVQLGLAATKQVPYALRAFPAAAGPAGKTTAADAAAAFATMSASLAAGRPAFLLSSYGRHWVLAWRMFADPDGRPLIEVRDPIPAKGDSAAAHRKPTASGTPCCPILDASVRGLAFSKHDLEEAPNSIGSKWLGKHVVVVPEAVGAEMMIAGPPAPERADPGAVAALGEILDLGQAQQAAHERAHDVATSSPDWKGWLAGLTPGTPILAERLEGGPPLARYFIVPLLDSFGKPRGLVNVDVAGGLLYEIRLVPAGSDPWWVGRQLPQGLVLQEAQGKLYTPTGPGAVARPFDALGAAVLLWNDGPFAGQPKLVWKCCAQSLTPFQPFYQITGADGTGLWLDVGGQLHSELDVSRGGL